MLDAQRLVDQLLKGGFSSGLAGGLVSGAVAGALASGKGGKLAKSALKAGGLALVAGVAYKAWQNHQQQQGKAAKPGGAFPGLDSLLGGTTAVAPAAANDAALAVVRGMIAAAKADGRVDGAEYERIFERLNAVEMTAEERAFLMDELRQPLNLDRVVAAAGTPEVAAEVYAAARLVVGDPVPAEREFLASLSQRLGLHRDLVAQLDAAVAAVPRA